MTFEELTWKPLNGGVQAKVWFSNGYGASIIQSPYSYGGYRGLYELAVLDEDGLCYDTPITDDVKGYLQPYQVEDYLAQIEALPPR